MKSASSRLRIRMLRRKRSRCQFAIIAALLLSCASLCAEPLHVLLTNDDGFEAQGITAMHKALLAAGYEVSVAAPREQQSGSSMRVTLGTIMVEKLEGNFWVIDGTPADSVSFALAKLLAEKRPDIVISGINFGQNLGSNANLSGTVGAAIMATQLSIPAIAVSAGLDLSERDAKPDRFPSTTAAFGPAAQFTVRFIKQLELSRVKDAPMLPPNQLVNINFPAIPGADIKGVALTNVARVGGFAPVYLETERDGEYKATLRHGDPIDPNVPNSDMQQFAEGYITISILDGDMNPSSEARKPLSERIDKFLAVPIR